MIRVLTLGVAAFALAGCSFLTEGVRQDISVSTTPSGAACVFMRGGQKIAEVNPTPGSAIIRKDKHDITVECEKEGYQKATMLNESDVAAASFGNIIIGGVPGIITDLATGASNKYDPKMNITLQAVENPTAAVSPTAMAPLTN
tara:strand:- start:302 stop:733 length:432 start_codon:yes stop_codon:yes gene_type:complete